jgi:PAS domain-containing protein
VNTLRSLWIVFCAFPPRRLAGMGAWLALVIAYYVVFKDDTLAADIGRFIGLVMVSLILGMWVVVMGRSAESYAKAKAGEHTDDVDLREHIWEITLSYLIFAGAVAYHAGANIGEPMELETLPPLLLACPLGVHALYLFVGPSKPNRVAGRIDTQRPALHAMVESAFGQDAYLILNRQLVIVAVSDRYLVMTGATRDWLLGKTVEEAFPENPSNSNGGSALERSFAFVLNEGKPDVMAPVRYDILGPDGEYDVKWWRPVNSPIIASSGQVAYIVNAVEDVTATYAK